MWLTEIIDHAKIKDLNQKIRNLYSLFSISKSDRRTLWLIEVLYADKGDLLELIRSKEDRMQISRA